MSNDKKPSKKWLDPHIKEILINTLRQVLALAIGHIIKELIEKIQF